MPHQDTTCPTPTAPNHQDLKAVLDALFRHADLDGIGFRGLCTWTPQSLIVTALLWSWSDESTLTKRFAKARKIAILTLGLTALMAATYQAFLKRLRRWTAVLAVAVVSALRQRLQQELPERYTIHGYVVFGVDGSRLELPRTGSHQDHFAPKAKAEVPRTAAAQKKADSPQMWLTVMFHVGSGLPWDYRLGPTDSSEREHLRQMIAALPAAALVTADAGFAGYECWEALVDSGRDLLIRVGSNVRLLRQLGYVREHDGIVYLWPKRQQSRHQPPLVLRLVVAHTGRHPMYLVTSVRDEERLPATQVLSIYKLRWGVELFYRHFKQSFGRRKLRSHQGDNAEVEAIWSLLGLWALCLQAQVELAGAGVPSHRVSVAGLLDAYRSAMKEYRCVPEPGESLRERLATAVIDAYVRANKSSRDYPRKKRPHAIGPPEIRAATQVEIETAKKIKDQHGTRLTA